MSGLPACDRGDHKLGRFLFARGTARSCCCFRHAVTYRPVVRTALVTSAIVGTVLTLINQGDLLFSGEVTGAMAWKIPLTYSVPYLVATVSALRMAWQPEEAG
jgi:hypothetical protein